MHLAFSADRWATALLGEEPGIRPFEEWPEDEPFRVMARKYDLTKEDLATIVQNLAIQAEERAERAGYGETV